MKIDQYGHAKKSIKKTVYESLGKDDKKNKQLVGIRNEIIHNDFNAKTYQSKAGGMEMSSDNIEPHM